MRSAGAADLETLVAHRRAMFREMGYSDEAALNSMSARFAPWLLERMNSGEYYAWLICLVNGAIAAGRVCGSWIGHRI